MTNQWTGKCSGCGAQIVKPADPRACNLSKIKCDGCKLKWCKMYCAKDKPKAYWRNYKKDRNDKSIGKASLYFNRWDIVDETWLLNNAGSLTHRELADKLGRSIFSVENRLRRLRKAERERSCV